MKNEKHPFRVYLSIAVSFAILMPTQLMAWGPEGHIVVAKVASARLSPSARTAVRKLLGRHTLDSVANYADQVRGQRPETSNWHFVDIPKDATDYDAARDCKDTPKGDCIINELARTQATLKDRSLPKAKRAEALKFVVHFVGDLHQPLHCADNHDRGGNDVKVTFFGKQSNLHRVWDSDIITESNLPPVEFAAQLDSWLDAQDTATLEKGTTVDWAQASHKLAVDDAYNIPADHQLDASYADANLPIIDQQLAIAGLRLAAILNAIFAPAVHHAPKHP
ncbi:MAG TPA: S1/P1 nuclease [Terriglobales bacterium]|nr:S1/P1 nuclease [Terriglobales bacterium]